ncbi:hypothetical protein F4818DRAFT_451080 [Hypoxylon cercidicola]|nr:hypothetical protein F4818DRAFT_451080 [Hypoxylon cercidicola]
MKFASEYTCGTDSPLELLPLKVLVTVGTAKILRNGSRLLPQLALGVAVLLLGAYLWSSKYAGYTLNHDYAKIVSWNPAEEDDRRTDGGLRVVVFGGGDVATLSKASWQVEGPNAGWTEILCEQLDCALYQSFIPPVDNDGGAMVSNSLFEAAVTRTLSVDNNTFGGLDYSWLVEHYPIPSHQDLLHQVDAFLAGPRPLRPPRETLWVFDIGFWDIWNLATLPRKLATHIIETQMQHVFSYIELLYSEAHNNESVAFSNCYAGVDLATARVTTTCLPRASFRAFIPKPFDVSLTPGFESARFTPPLPHTKAEQMRNAAFLTRHWDKTVQDMVNEWVRLPDLEVDDNDDDLSGIKDADLLLNKKSVKVDGITMPPARREAITYDTTGYIQELMVERQLRNADIVDHSGLGSTAMAEGYSEVWEPCIKKYTVFDDSNNGTGNGTKDSTRWSVCDAPDQHLFWTEFTVNRRAIFEIGIRAADVFKRHVKMDAEWLRKSREPLSSLRKGPDRAPLRVEDSKT